MIQEVYIPKNAKLRQIVSFLYYGEFNVDTSFQGTTAIFPNATTNLSLVLDEGVDFNQSKLDNSIYATCSSAVHLETHPGGRFIGIQMHSYGMFFLSGVPVDQVQDNLLPMEYFFKSSAMDRITDQLKSITSSEERFSQMEHFLLEEIQTIEVDPRLPYGISILKNDPNLKMDDLSETLCLSSRGLQKLFKKYVGMSPVYFKKIKRFNEATRQLIGQPHASLTSIALQCGYYDQAHFIKDFKQFGGITPSSFLKTSLKSSDFYNFNPKEESKLAFA